jgi:hypothetical protein
MAWPDLFDLPDLASILQVPSVDTETATRCRRQASGWLMGATGVGPTGWPNPIPDDVWAWALELAAIAFRNPAGAANESLDDYSVSADRSRRDKILADARASYGGAGTPVYSFPDWDWHWTVVPVVPAVIQ